MEKRLYGRTLVCYLAGELDLQAAMFLRQDLEKELQAPMVEQLLLDFSRVTFIDSSGLGVILGRYRQVTDLGKEMAIAGASAAVCRVLELGGLGRLVPFYPTVAEALPANAGGQLDGNDS
ncbi:MAG: STAS domain-containing protein [Clostridia bacterium]|nr:MAG: STAS domain-containing protein [Clostridia bacterium]